MSTTGSGEVDFTDATDGSLPIPHLGWDEAPLKVLEKVESSDTSVVDAQGKYYGDEFVRPPVLHCCDSMDALPFFWMPLGVAATGRTPLH